MDKNGKKTLNNICGCCNTNQGIGKASGYLCIRRVVKEEGSENVYLGDFKRIKYSVCRECTKRIKKKAALMSILVINGGLLSAFLIMTAIRYLNAFNAGRSFSYDNGALLIFAVIFAAANPIGIMLFRKLAKFPPPDYESLGYNYFISEAYYKMLNPANKGKVKI